MSLETDSMLIRYGSTISTFMECAKNVIGIELPVYSEYGICSFGGFLYLYVRQSDVQVQETAKMLKDGNEFDRLLARDNKSVEKGLLSSLVGDSSIETASVAKPEPTLQTRWQK